MPISETVALASAILFSAVVAAAAWSDLRCRVIPNRFVAGLAIASTLLLTDGRMPIGTYGTSLLLALLTFVAGGALFVRGWVGGGDVKLLSAMLLWFPPGAALFLIETMLVLGGALSFCVLAARSLARRGLLPAGAVQAALLAEDLSVPYGVAIAGAGLLTFQFVWL